MTGSSEDFICKTERILEKARARSQRRSKPSRQSPSNKHSTRSNKFVSHPIHDLPVTAAIGIPTAVEDERSNVSQKTRYYVRGEVEDRSASTAMVPPLRENSKHKEYSTDNGRKSRDAKNSVASDALSDVRPEKIKSPKKKIREPSTKQRDASSPKEVYHLLNQLKVCNQRLIKGVAQMEAQEGYNAEIANSVADFLKKCDKVFDQKGIKIHE